MNVIEEEEKKAPTTHTHNGWHGIASRKGKGGGEGRAPLVDG